MAEPQGNPFDDLAEHGVRSANPFDRMGDDLASPTSTSGAFARSTVRGILPALGGIIGGHIGGEAGAAAGAFGGPAAVATVPAGAIAGGLTGAYLGSTAMAGAQHWALSKLPDSWREAIGMDDRQERLDEGQHPIASFLGGLAPYAVTMNPTSAARKALPANPTAMQRIMAHPASARVFGGAAMGGVELGQEAIGPEPVDWRKVAIATGMGVVLNRPNRIGERIGEWGAAPTRRALGIASPEVVAPIASITEQMREHGILDETPAAPAAPPAARGIAPTLFHAPTVAQAADTRVMGPGVTEEVFHGSHEAPLAARMAAQENARTERETIGPAPVPDLHSLARRSTPDLFNRYDELQGQRSDLAASPDNPQAQIHLAAVEREIADLAPQVAAAYRRAGEVAGVPAVPPPEAAALPGRPIAEQRQAIIDDVTRQLVRAGRPEAEARAAAHLIAARYEARAAQFRGALGSAEDLYRSEGAEILGPGMRSRQAAGIPQPRGPRKVNEPALSLFQFLAHRGGLAPHPDVQHALGENPFLPGFGRLIRQNGMTLDHAREAAVAAGYLHDEAARHGGVSESDINQLLDAIGEESRGNKLYRAGHTPKDADAVFEEMHPEGREALLRHEVAPEQRSALMTEDDAREVELFQRKRADMIAEREAQGQMNLPGTERITQGELAQRLAEEKLKPKVEQRPMDEGLFGDEKGQKELFQTASTETLRERGFDVDTPLYHQTHMQNVAPILREGFDLSKGRARLSDEQVPDGVFLKTDKKDIGVGAVDRNDVAQVPVYLRRGKVETFRDRDHLASYLNRDAEYNRLAAESRYRDSELGREFEAKFAKDGRPGWASEEEGVKDFLDAWTLENQRTATLARTRATQVLKEAGIDTVVIENDAGSFGRKTKTLIALSGDQIAHAGEVEHGKVIFQGARGKIRLAPGRRPVITLMRDANASTFIHETGHDWLEQLMHDAAHAQAPEDLRADAATVLAWLGVDKPDAIARRQHEKFARGFEQYLREGVAPSAALADVFARFKTWLTQIYQTIKGLGAPINDDIRRVFDRMLVAEPQHTVIAPERAQRPSLADIHEADAAEAIHPEADAMGDRVEAEKDRYYTDASEEYRREHDAELAAKAAFEAEGREPGTGIEPPGEEGQGGGGSGEVVGAGLKPQPEPRSGGGGGEHGAVVEGAARAERQGAASPRPDERSGDGEESRHAPLAADAAPAFEPGDERTVDRAGNIRVENLTSLDDIAQAIHDSADRNAEFQSARGSMTKGQMMDLADAMGLEPEKINEAKLAHLLGGTANLAPRILAARKLVVQSAGIVSEAMKKAATGSDEDVAHLAFAIARHDMIQGVLAGATAEWGRAGSAFHSLLSGWGQAEAVGDFLKANTGRTLFQLKQIAKLGTQLDSPGKIAKYLRDAQNRSFGGMILEYWINGLISGPATHTTYMIGNAILAAEKAGPETAAAALIGSLRKAMGREGETVRLGEVGAQFRAAGRALPAATEAAIEAMRSGQTTLLPGEAARPLIPFSGDTSLVTARGATNAPVSWADVGAQAFGALRGVRDGLMSGAALIAAGGEAGAPLMGLHWSPLGQIPDLAIRGVPAIPVGSALRMPGRFIAAIHSFFRATNYAMEKGRLAYRTAANEGLTGTAFDARVGELWQNPSEALMEQARKEATELTLMGQGGAFVKALSQLTNAKVDLPILGAFAPLKFIDPFVHIGANVINQSIVHRSPVGVLSKEIRADLMGRNGTIAQDTAMARMLVGTALSIGFGGLAAQGFASGSGPKDPKESAMWRLAGNQAHSVRIGDMWIDVHRLGPMGMLMSIAADMHDVAHHVSEGEYTEAAAHLQHAVTQNVLDESFMRGPADLIKAVEDPGRYGDAYIRNMLASFVPFSVGMAQMARASDPYSRQARTVVDAMIAKIPGYSQGLLPHRDIWGEPMAALHTLGPQGALALWEKQVSTDPVNLAMLALGVFPGQVPRKIRNVDLTDEQFDDFVRLAGRMTKSRLDMFVRSPDWRTWPNHIKVDVIQETLRQSREAARGLMMMKYPSIARDATAAKLEKLQD